MKTTLDLPDDLLIEAKAVAARRRTTLKAMVEHALRREIAPQAPLQEDGPYELNELGMLCLKRRPGAPVTLEMIRDLQEQADAEDFARVMEIREGKP
jgi:hypothetical protein